MTDLPILPDDAPAPGSRSHDPAALDSSADSGIGVYGAPRPAIPERVPLTPRFAGCASGAGFGAGADATGSFRRLPAWLKVKLPGKGEYAGTKTLLRSRHLHTVC
jgi:hypothetical protein